MLSFVKPDDVTVTSVSQSFPVSLTHISLFYISCVSVYYEGISSLSGFSIVVCSRQIKFHEFFERNLSYVFFKYSFKRLITQVTSL